jgi:carboxypeptidase PM20D1
VTALCLVLGGTDSRHYIGLTPSVFRLRAMRVSLDNLAKIHRNNERLAFENCDLLLNFYTRLLVVDAEGL